MANLSHNELMQALLTLKAENEALKAKANGKAKAVSCKVGEKGGLAIYGMGRFPVHFYLSQWEKLMANLDEIKAFIEENKAKFSTKD